MAANVTVAIIDDGVNCGYYPSIDWLAFNLSINQNGNIVKRRNKLANSHGTICAAIIKNYAPNSLIGSIKVLSGKTGRGKVIHLIIALDWCTKNNVKLVKRTGDNIRCRYSYPRLAGRI